MLKRIAIAAATLLVLPELASFWLRARVMGPDRALQGSSQLLALVPGIVGQYVRRAFLMRVLAACHPSATVEFGVLFSKAGARLDENAYVGPRCHLGLVHLERDVLLAAGVHVPSGGMIHGIGDPDRPIRDQPGEVQLVRIGEGSWVGSAAVVMAHVGRGSVIGAGAVVTKPIPDRVIAGGVPAKVIRSRVARGAGGAGGERGSGGEGAGAAQAEAPAAADAEAAAEAEAAEAEAAAEAAGRAASGPAA